MDALKVNTPEELHQAIGEFLQSDYSRENFIMVYDEARKSANRFRVTYSALPKVPTYNNDPLDGLSQRIKFEASTTHKRCTNLDQLERYFEKMK